MLVDHADARRHRIARAPEGGRLVVDQDLAVIGLVQPIEDVHQRALAGTVLAEQGVYLTGLDHQIDRIVGNEPAEALGDASQFELQRDLQNRCERTI
jgi:hypothetical protein